MIEPGGIPQYTGDFDKLATAVSQLRTYATGIRNNGQDVHSRFQATAGYYKAPEAEQLFSSTRPVMDTADTFATHIESLADALDIFAAEARPHADRLKQLKLDAIAFVAEVQGDDGWTKDQDKVDRDRELVDGVSEARVAFQDAERRAANKIEAIAPAECRPTWIADDGTHAKGMYGESAATLKDMESLPWGSPDERTYERWSLDWWRHGAKSWVWDGLAKDSIWGSIDGIGTLLGYHGLDAQSQAWNGLRRTFVGGYAYGMDLLGEGEHLSSWQRDSEAYAKEFGKQFVAYDLQKKDPARAHAVVFFNLITLASGPAAGVARLGKGGAIAKAAGTVAKIGDVLDPLSGSLKAVKALSDLPKVSEVLANVTDHFQIPKSKFPGGILDLDHRYRIDKDSRLVPINADGTPNLAPAPRGHEGDLATGTGRGERELAGVGVSGHGQGAAGRAGEGVPPGGSHANSPDSSGGARSHGPVGRDEFGGGGSSLHGDPHGGGPTGRGAAPDTPGHGRGSVEPPPGVSQHGPSDGHHMDSSHADANGHDPHAAQGEALPHRDGPPDIDPAKYARNNDDLAQVHTGRIQPEQEAGVTAELTRAKMAPQDQEKVFRALRKDPYGSGVADMITRGHLRGLEGYEKLLDMCKRGPSNAEPKGMIPAAYMAMRLATDLQEHGVARIGVELDTKTFDLDVYTRHSDGSIEFAYQLKDVDNIKGIKRAAEKSAEQLSYDGMSHRIAVLDVHQSMADLTPRAFREAEFRAQQMEGTFLLRFTDGSITVPPVNPTFP
ncbi:hypothetical protein ACFXPM_04590 [Streptomyces sp. NPDC059095]|uniref:hypothetical protein n=1 Tax=Streptomyces sp. NPDC059095 TaxID=3346726 RepID=UPI00367C6A19